MENLVLHIAKSLVDEPDSVSVKIDETPESVTVQLSVCLLYTSDAADD